jgi:DNA-binding MarR family transcriptional regulator
MSKQSAELDEMAHELMRHLEVLTKRFLLPQKSSQLSRSETALLRHLADHGSSTMSDASAGLGLAMSSTTGIVDGLVEAGLVTRERPEDDRRTVRIALTKRGQKAHDTFMIERVDLGHGMLAPLGERERKSLLALFRKMTDADE